MPCRAPLNPGLQTAGPPALRVASCLSPLATHCSPRVITLIACHFHTGVTPNCERMHTMRDFHCPNCGQRLAFENSKCLNCGSALGCSLDEGALLAIARGQDSEHAGAVDASEYRWRRMNVRHANERNARSENWRLAELQVRAPHQYNNAMTIEITIS
jgi:hypothetical protein